MNINTVFEADLHRVWSTRSGAARRLAISKLIPYVVYPFFRMIRNWIMLQQFLMALYSNYQESIGSLVQNTLRARST
jgi:hypothetical protein